jgi:hypothetical protein
MDIFPRVLEIRSFPRVERSRMCVKYVEFPKQVEDIAIC